MNCYSLPLSDFSRDLMLISKKPESCWLVMAAASCLLLIFPPAAAAAAVELEPAGGTCCHLTVTHATLCWRDPETTRQPCFTPPLVCCPRLSAPWSLPPLPPSPLLNISNSAKLRQAVGGNASSPLNNCMEAESAGHNPLSWGQLIIASVCLCAEPGTVDSAAFVVTFDVSVRKWQVINTDRTPGEYRRYETKQKDP